MSPRLEALLLHAFYGVATGQWLSMFMYIHTHPCRSIGIHTYIHTYIHIYILHTAYSNNTSSKMQVRTMRAEMLTAVNMLVIMLEENAGKNQEDIANILACNNVPQLCR